MQCTSKLRILTCILTLNCDAVWSWTLMRRRCRKVFWSDFLTMTYSHGTLLTDLADSELHLSREHSSGDGWQNYQTHWSPSMTRVEDSIFLDFADLRTCMTVKPLMLFTWHFKSTYFLYRYRNRRDNAVLLNIRAKECWTHCMLSRSNQMSNIRLWRRDTCQIITSSDVSKADKSIYMLHEYIGIFHVLIFHSLRLTETRK